MEGPALLLVIYSNAKGDAYKHPPLRLNIVG
jgi:hypothetical protein